MVETYRGANEERVGGGGRCCRDRLLWVMLSCAFPRLEPSTAGATSSPALITTSGKSKGDVESEKKGERCARGDAMRSSGTAALY